MNDVLAALEAESIHILREVAAEARKPVLLYSGGKDSSVLLHLARKAFHPAGVPLPLLHIASRWDFAELLAFRDATIARFGLDLIVHTGREGARLGVNPFDHDPATYVRLMLTEALKEALAEGGFDVAIGGARRDEEASRAKERIVSIRGASQGWDPRRQRPEFWNLFNLRLAPGETARVFPLSNWTEMDVWHYIAAEAIAIAPLYFAAERKVVRRGGALIAVDDERMRLLPDEVPRPERVRFRTLGCWPLTAAMRSTARDLDAVIAETLGATLSERSGRLIDHAETAAMERQKREGYF